MTSTATNTTDPLPVVGKDDVILSTPLTPVGEDVDADDNDKVMEDAPHTSNDTPMTSRTTTTCHVLPCNIEFTGMAQTHVYFDPVAMKAQDWQDGQDFQAATFRGRGLLAMKNNEYNNIPRDSSSGNNDDDENNNIGSIMQGAVFAIDGQDVTVKAIFDHMLEWHHEHNLQSVRYAASRTSTEQPTMNRIRMAHEWSQIAQAVRHPPNRNPFVSSQLRLVLVLAFVCLVDVHDAIVDLLCPTSSHNMMNCFQLHEPLAVE
jgi:Ribonuclease H2 non-catalytic subunit (Ylr154p-like)